MYYISISLFSIKCEILSFIGTRKKEYFANYLISHVNGNQALFGYISLKLKISRLK